MSWVSTDRSFSVAPDQAFFRPAALALVAGGDWEGAAKVIEVRKREKERERLYKCNVLYLKRSAHIGYIMPAFHDDGYFEAHRCLVCSDRHDIC